MESLDRSEQARPAGQRGLPPFLFVALISSALFLALFAWQSVRAFRESVFVRDDGWSAVARGPEWIVGAVGRDGPAASALAPGDVIVALNGDARAGRIGPGWQLGRMAVGEPYELRVRRDGVERAVDLAARTRPDPGYRPWIVIYLVIALANLIVAVMIAVVRPEDRIVQLAFTSEVLTAAFMLWMAVRSVQAVRQDAMALLLGLCFPLFYIFGYLFLERFPRRFETTPVWRSVRQFVVWGGIALWISRNVITLIRALPEATRLDVVDAAYGPVRALQAAGLLPDFVYVVVVIAAMFGVQVRNYRQLGPGSDRRRVLLIFWGRVVALVPALLAAGASAAAAIVQAGPNIVAMVDVGRLSANALAIASPITFAYAIIRHRVLGFRLAVRVGIQYVLARNALRAAVALPMAWIVYTVIAYPDRTVGEVLFAGYAKINLAILVLAAIGLQYRTQIASAIDRRFFRAAYDQEEILRRLVDAVKQADSAAEIAALASREIDAALHVGRVLVFYHDARAGAFAVGFSTQAMPARIPLADQSALIQELARSPQARTVEELRARASPRDVEWLDQLHIDLAVPMRGIDHNLVGLLMVGEKRSEEPFTSQDRRLLQLVAGQIAAVYEVLTLREKVGRHEAIQADVLASLDERRINLVKECPACGRCYDRTDERCADDGAELVLSLPVDRTLDGKYRLERLIGHGGMGAVYEAHDVRLNRRVAVKVIKGSSLQGMAVRRRFAREAQACARLSHPSIVRVYDFGAPEGQAAYLVMEHVAGRPWSLELERCGTFTPAEAATLFDQVFDGMEAAHAAGVLHRDLKPDNLLIAVTPDGGRQVKILDFGLAKVRESSFADPKSRTVAGVTMGTFGYMSPEQLAAEDVDERTDVYALGVVALETLTGPLPPFGPNFHPIIEAEVERRLLTPAMTVDQHAVAQAIAKALAPSRYQRFASIRAFRDALIPALRACAGLPGVAVVDADGVRARVTPAHAPTEAGDAARTRLDPPADQTRFQS
jgi:tRNA A-37 threonylcarbamoyl transferase component Bud32